MPDPGEIRTLKPSDELHICPACGYALGFHTSFVNASANKDNPVKSTRETWRVILICPECGARYDIGWRVSFAEFESKFVRTPVSPVVSVIAEKKEAPPKIPPGVVCLPPPGDNRDEDEPRSA